MVMQMVRKRERFIRDNKGLSDAVAIGIFVSIVVVLAAVIGSVAMSKAPSGVAPASSIVIKPLSANTAIIKHQGGDGILLSDMKIYVYNATMALVTGYPRLASTIPASDLVDSAPTGTFNNGDVIRLTGLTAGVYTVVIEYAPLQQTIAESRITLG